MTITLTAPEVALFTAFKGEDESVEQAFHRFLLPSLQSAAEVRLQELANAFRQLTPELQLEAIQVLADWQAMKSQSVSASHSSSRSPSASPSPDF